jgi:hypothetical protein
MRDVAALRQKQAALLLVIIAGVQVLAVDIALIAAHGELVGGGHGVGNHHAPISNAVVAAGRDAVVDFEIEILRCAALPNDKGVASDEGLGRDFAGHDAIAARQYFGSPASRRGSCRRTYS